MDKRLERQARNEALPREVNERISALDRGAASMTRASWGASSTGASAT